MRFFDRWRRRAAPTSTPPAAAPAGASPKATQGARTPVADHFIVPDGHNVTLYGIGIKIFSFVDSCKGGVWLAHIGGMGSDEPEEGLDWTLSKLDELMRAPRPRVLLSHTSGPISTLMAPNDPKVIEYAGVLVWAVDASILAGALGAPSLIQRWLRCIYTIGTRGTPPLQMVFLSEMKSPRAQTVAALIRGMGLEVRIPDTKFGKDTILIEVHRPEGSIVSALVGAHHAAADLPDASSYLVNQARDRAEEDGDTERQQRLEAEERDALENKLAPGVGELRVSPVGTAFHLRRLQRAVVDDGDVARPALYEELLRREVPLLLIRDPKTGGNRLHSLPGGVAALQVYADALGVQMNSRRQGMEWGSFAMVAMSPPKLFEWAAGQSVAIAMYVYSPSNECDYVVLTADVVKSLAQGRTPTSPIASLQ